MVKTASARSKINSWFKKEARGENVAEGKERLEREIERNGFTSSQLLLPDNLKTLLSRYGFNNIDDMFAAIGYGQLTAGKVFGKLRDEYIKSLSEEERLRLGYRTTADGQIVYYSPEELPDEIGKGDLIKFPKATAAPSKNKVPAVPAKKVIKPQYSEQQVNEKKVKRADSSVIVEGIENCAVHLAKCCHPVPGDPIVGYVTQSGGVGVHKENCSNIKNIRKYSDRSQKDTERFNRLVSVHWSKENIVGVFDVEIGIQATDRDFLLIDILSVLREEHINVGKVNTHVSADLIADISLTITVKSAEQYERIVGRIMTVKDVITVKRV